jgi:hypothetical protein
MDIDTRKIVETVLALLCLTLHDGAWDEKLLHLEPGRHSQIGAADRQGTPGIGAIVQQALRKASARSRKLIKVLLSII